MYRKIVAYVVILLLLLLPGFYLRNPFGYLPCIFLLVITGISFLYILLLKKTFSFLQPSERISCQRGVDQKFSVTIENKSFLIYPRITCRFYKNNLFGQVAEVTAMDTVLSSHEKKNFSFEVKFDHLGTYEVGISSVRIYDMFGIFYLTYKNCNKSNIAVKPHIVNVDNLDFSDVTGRQTSSSAAKSKIESDDYSGIRQYVIGDPIKNIHWKISAHTQDYMVRLFESYTSFGITIYTDFEATGYSNELLMSIYDCLVETTYSIANHVLEKSEDVELIFNKDKDVQLLLPKSQSDMTTLVMDFPVLSLSNNNELIEMLEANASRQYGLDVVIVCTANLNELLVEHLIGATASFKKVYLFYVVPETKKNNLSEEEKLMLNSMSNWAIDYFVISSAEELQNEEVKKYA